MSFLSPFWLALAAAAAVPLLIHLLRRRIGVRVDFPAARYLARAEQEHSRSLRLRNLLLMILRVLIVLALAFAAARPLARWAGAGHAATGVAVVLDNSMSTSVVVQGRPELDRIRDAALALLGSASSGDRAWVVTADGIVRGGSPAALREVVRQVTPLAGAGDLALAVRRAGAAVNAAQVDARRIVVLTDGQRTAWPAALRIDNSDVAVWMPDDSLPATRAVNLAEPRPARWSPSGTIAVRVSGTDSVPFRVLLGDRTTARGTAHAHDEAILHLAPDARGWVAGRVDIEPDELPRDDARWFAVWIGAAPAVSVSAGAGPFARNAVDVLRSSGRVTSGSDVVVAAADEATRLPGVLLAPDDPVRVGAANRALAKLGVPWRFGEAVRSSQLVRAAARDADADSAGATLDGTTVRVRYTLQPSGSGAADTLARVGREPWVVAGPGYVLVASPVDPAATNLPLRAAWVPWLGSLLTERVSANPGRAYSLAPGAALPRPEGVNAIEYPDGHRAAVADTIAAPGDPGVYYLQGDGRRLGALVVNPEPRESDLARLTPTALAAVFRAPRVSRLATPDDSRAIYDAPVRRPLVAPLLFAALALLLVETVAARTSLVRTR